MDSPFKNGSNSPSKKKSKTPPKMRRNYMKMRSKMRAKPNKKISLQKYKKYIGLKGDLYPHKDFDPEKDDLHYPEDTQDKSHFYSNLRNRLDYNKSHSNFKFLEFTKLTGP